MSSPITTVIFDFDGVLADTERLHMGAFQDVFAARGWTLDEAAYFERYLGCDDRGLVVAYAQDHALTLTARDADRLADEKADVFAGYLESGQVLFADAKACVAALATTYSLGIASGALHREIVTILDAGGLLPYFPVIVGADDVEACKPAPDPYLAAARLIGVPASSCVAVEDSLAGLQAAQSAGMRTVAITTTSPRHMLGVATLVIDRLSELSPAVIGSLGAPRAVW